MTKVDILAFGVHPDDVELGCSGTIIASVQQGKKVAIVDLTQGELGTRGTVETRYKEAADAARIMGVDWRENLKMEDGFFQINEANIRKVITAIRKYQPEIILCNALEDRHPDHGRSSQLVEEAAFMSGLRKIETSLDGVAQDAWRPKYVFHYIQDRYLKPDFVFDISAHMQQKIAAVQAYTTQFYTTQTADDEPQTYISTPDFLETVKARALMLGKRIGVRYAEGYLTKKMVGVTDFNSFVQETT
ncbi:bacillithiol biosynthesis deacetylase BshB1 [Filimonas lacunae]|uniref:Bacillithiol biosynthesis deacetylase BshB1 n=1 Tax=Filimonas lacunae TaxID=477680 RepID=A0A173MK25_9BACT|nr:bacillithiol biosynthesis deacetylase BshB1 [Filimonas lacunae]BAV07850.1 LMBE-related protein [Filimonas lacunae]SIT05607.1 bacillithiol biosynthesis deacetylase BshB1 [Filimonas lacunae]